MLHTINPCQMMVSFALWGQRGIITKWKRIFFITMLFDPRFWFKFIRLSLHIGLFLRVYHQIFWLQRSFYLFSSNVPSTRFNVNNFAVNDMSVFCRRWESTNSRQGGQGNHLRTTIRHKLCLRKCFEYKWKLYFFKDTVFYEISLLFTLDRGDLCNR